MDEIVSSFAIPYSFLSTPILFTRVLHSFYLQVNYRSLIIIAYKNSLKLKTNNLKLFP